MDKLEFFKEISKIPRVTFNETKIADYIENLAKEKGLKTFRDEINNLVVYKPGTKGKENNDSVILQAHIDMVGEKLPESDHNFDTDPIELIFEGNWVRANKTTLGADDGYGVSYMLEIMTSDEYEHPPLELVFTAAEEYGLYGALKFDMKPVLKSRKMIGLDSGDDYLTCASCSGGLIGEVILPKNLNKEFNKTIEIKVSGLKGGHSGMDIVKEIGNSIKILSEINFELNKSLDTGLVSIKGGSKNNAIPRDGEIIIGTNEVEDKKIVDIIEHFYKEYKLQYEHTDPDLTIEYEIKDEKVLGLEKEENDKVSELLFLFPSGVFNYSRIFPDLAWSSINFGVIETLEDSFRIEFYARSPQEFLIDKTKNLLEIISKDFKLNYLQQFPGWNFEENSELREILKDEYRKKFGKEIEVVASHGGMEGGVFKANLEGLDIITIGPQCENLHSPYERMNIPSYNKIFELVVNILQRL